MDYDRIASSVPVNSQAARQMRPGEEYVPAVIVRDYLDFPLRLCPIPKSAKMNPKFVDFTGMTFGRLVVLGRPLRSEAKRIGLGKIERGLWLCRCSCGRYCIRKSSYLGKVRKDPQPRPDRSYRCGYCRHIDRLRDGSFHHRAQV